MNLVTHICQAHGIAVRDACHALQVAPASYYRHLQGPSQSVPAQERRASPRALSEAENAEVLAVLNSVEFRDLPPRQVFAALLAKGKYLCSWRTMYRALNREAPVRERRQAPRRSYATPRLEARGPRQVWTWDITKLRGPVPRVFYYLYVIIDIFSRYVVGWTLARSESGELAREFIEATYEKEGVTPGELSLHADRGSPMRSQTVAELLVELGVEKSHSRPRVSNDNPYSEAHFKTVKYDPSYPERFASYEHAWRWCEEFFEFYNDRHHHSALALLTPSMVHHGQVEEVLAHRDEVLAQAYAAHPERFVKGPPRAERPPRVVYINRAPVEETPGREPPPEAPLPATHKPEGDEVDGLVQGAAANEVVPGPGRELVHAGVVEGEGAACQDPLPSSSETLQVNATSHHPDAH